jgi:hypothetical protein
MTERELSKEEARIFMLKQIKDRWITVAALIVLALVMFLTGLATPDVQHVDACEHNLEDCLNHARQGEVSECVPRYEDCINKALKL